MYQVKIFMGYKADNQCNEWFKKNPNIEVIDFKYQYCAETYQNLVVLYKTIENGGSGNVSC